ncbi:MAG: hypothetical protein J3Q66DRAFT_321571 [Benniella sp.]|nr:MAG: hypothetical protein J3Q66DRAFT_321571 [Benniella sp.]
MHLAFMLALILWIQPVESSGLVENTIRATTDRQPLFSIQLKRSVVALICSIHLLAFAFITLRLPFKPNRPQLFELQEKSEVCRP